MLLLKIDEIYQLDHVTAYNEINKRTKSTHQRVSTIPPNSYSTKSLPTASKKFRVQKVIEKLQKHFTDCWHYEKSNSSKLSFYNKIKNKFARESYIDAVKGFSRRYSTTQLRISAHDLEIERGRYTNSPREERLCQWCKISMGSCITEDEDHILYDCDLYADLRAKLVTKLNNSPHVQSVKW